MYEDGWKWMKIQIEKDENTWKLIEMDENGWKCMKMDGN